MNKTRQTVMAPEAPLDGNVIWIDTSSVEPIQKVFLNGEWKPLKDSDVDAEFKTHQKVSDISLQKSSPTSTDPNDSVLPTVKRVNGQLSYKVSIGGFTQPSGEQIGPDPDIEIDPPTALIISPGETINYVFDDTFVQRNEIDELYILTSSETKTDLVTTIRFTTGSDSDKLISLSYYYDESDLENSLYWANEQVPEIEIDSEYVIAIWDNIAVMTKIRTINPHPNA